MLTEDSLADQTTSKNSDGAFEPFHISAVPTEEFSRGERFGMSWRHLSSFGGGSQIGMSLETLLPGKQANQAHYHMLEEEHVMVLEGELVLRLGSQEYLMTADHYVVFPAGQKVGHSIRNDSDKPVRYLVFGTNNPAEVSVATDTGRVGVRLLGRGFRGDATMEYWQHADTGPR
jgi:uncharacterized cupin superfamily protein